MPTTTLFQVLELSTGTWTIETVVAQTPARGLKTDEELRAMPPADPWWEQAHTQMLKEVCR